jgi:adenylosuccinate synthase
MPATILIGAQWGDEGKGRVADWLAAQSQVVARYAGGDNAGHTVYVGDRVFKLNLIPSGVLHSHVVCVLGNGLVINPLNLLREMDELRGLGVEITPDRVIVSSRAHIISPAHIALDKAAEQARGKDKIGTTLRGIGPAYMDKTGRTGIRAGLMHDPEAFADALYAQIEAANVQLAVRGLVPLNAQESAEVYIDAAMRLKPYVRDTSHYINQRLAEGAQVLCEGAQGTLLDIDHGDYPFVTSSSPTAGGALIGLGFGPRHVERVVGVAKAYATRVGSGPMVTELDDAIAERLRGTGEHFWDEFGTVTRRPRRCGWLDLVALRYASQVSGFTELVLTKLDILSGFETIGIATAYEINGERVEDMPSTIWELVSAKPVVEMLTGWEESLGEIRKPQDLPTAARRYIERVSELCRVPIRTVSVGPERDQLVHF